MTTIEIIKDDITQIHVDVIVNAANSSLLGGGGVDGAIHRKGGASILEECQKIRARQGGCKTGHAVITTAGNLPAQYVVHTVGPVWQDGHNEEEALLAQCYIASLNLADELGCQTIAFPNISTGIYHFPKHLAAHTAIGTVKKHLYQLKHIQKIIFVCFDMENFLIYEDVMKHYPDA